MINAENELPVAAVDLFCGVGGLTYGLIKSGIPVRAGVDLDESCKYAYEANNDVDFIHKNIRDFTAKDLENLYGEESIKILVGCAPCQPFSQHTQKNKDRKLDGKWELINYFLELVKEVKPVVISMENVPQIAKQDIFSEFVEQLEEEGYSVTWNTVFCPDYGIPQNRRRMVLLASKLGEIKLIPPTHSRENYKTVADTIKGLAPVIAGEEGSQKDPLHRSAALAPINLERIRTSTPGGTWRDWPEKLRSPCHQKKSGKTYSSVYSRMEWDSPGPTITTQFFSFGTGRFGHPEQDRALSLREGALFQTFPRKYKFIDKTKPFSFKKTGMHIGNAVPVRLGEVIGRSIKKHMKEYYE